MSDTQPTPTPADAAPKAPPQEPAAAAPAETPKTTDAAPPWGDDPSKFDPEKAWSLIQGLRADKERLSSRVITDEQQARLSEYERLVEASKSDLERAQEAAQTQKARAEALLSRTVRSEVKALAADAFADPEDAAAFLDLGKYATSDGDVNTEAIKGDLADLLARKPHLGKQVAPQGMRPNPAQGRSASPPLGLSEQIAAAEQAGDMKTVLRLKSRQLLNPQG